VVQERHGPLEPETGAGDPLNAETPPEGLVHFITPAKLRFVRNHFPVPHFGRQPALRIGGAVAQPLALSARDLSELPAVTLTVTTECAGNNRASVAPPVEGENWGSGAVSTAQWTGVPLRAILEKAGLKETAVEVSFGGADAQYVRSLPLDKALDPDTIVAWEMNGAPIPARFGGPLRLIVPGWYGMASVKWLARIEALVEPFSGEFQSEKYHYAAGEPVSQMRVKSLLTEPASGQVVAREPLVIRGFAWGGEGGIAGVQIAVGRTDDDWREARLVGPALPHAWRRFELAWTPPWAGRYLLRSRATDRSGATQPDTPQWNEGGYGANAVQQVAVTVK
jgi:DMSO/TMAO reductase YedYZ molybdopterin-dependent catalytic subunit